MAETIKGVGVFWGIGSSFAMAGTGIPTTGTPTLRPQSIDFGVEAERVDIADYKGETVGSVFFNQKQTLSIEVIPTAGTIANAKGASILPEPGALVTITDTVDTELSEAASQSGKYIFIRGSKRRSNKDVVRLTFELEQYLANDISGTVAS
jgi:L-asparaginase/Glu-tRNA(Gln) amidotransferase subunit D